ncbi:MAG: PIN domain-containing protein [Fimbriimonadaceae bacterium]
MDKLNVFVDTNVLLDLYGFTKDDLNSISIAVDLVSEQGVKLFVNSLLVDEFERNRENKLKESIRSFEIADQEIKLPNVCNGLKEYENVVSHNRKMKQLQRVLRDELVSLAKSRELPADRIIEQLLSKAEVENVSSDLLSRAHIRSSIGNPPISTSSGHIGDGVHWLDLLDRVPQSEDIHLVTSDKGFYSSLDSISPHPFLVREWANLKLGSVSIYSSISEFISINFPDVKLPGDMRRLRLISLLERSSSFTATHSTVELLGAITNFRKEEMYRMISALRNNNQVWLICTDKNIEKFYYELAMRYYGEIDGYHMDILEGFFKWVTLDTDTGEYDFDPFVSFV